MLARLTGIGLGLVILFAARSPAGEPFNVPLRINMGGFETVDSLGRTWLGDGGGDPLNIRPDDRGGAQEANPWGTVLPESLTALGYDPIVDAPIFTSIRWDVGDDGVAGPEGNIDWRMEIPLPNGSYLVNMYFNEGCCPNRHFKIELQGEIVVDDVSYLLYDPLPALGKVGKLGFPVDVTEQVLRIGLLPCPECPDANPVVDQNAILDALEIVSGDGCDNQGMDLNCTYDPASDTVTGTWKDLPSAEAYRVLKNGAPFGADLPDDAVSFSDTDPGSNGPIPIYTVQALDGGVPFSECRCSVKTFVAPRDLFCSTTPGINFVDLAWTPAIGKAITGYQVKRNGTVVGTPPRDASTFQDQPAERFVDYEVVPVTDPPGLCNTMACRVVVESNPFAIPLRINMGGRETVDSKGRTWLGDGPGAGDPLGIRVDDLSGTNWIELWNLQAGSQFVPESLSDLGFDPNNANDVYIFTTIRWDLGDDGIAGDPLDNIDWRMEIAVPNESYLVNLYFNEGCCTFRHFKLELQGEMKDEDVSYLDYDALNPGIGRLGRISYQNVAVTDGYLRIALLPCPDCPGGGDQNAILDALEVLPAGCGDPTFRQCPRNFSCASDPDGNVTLTWEAPLCMDVTGYEIYKDGTLLKTVAGTTTATTDTMTTRVAMYQLKTLVGAGVEPCDPWTCQAVAENLLFPIPLRINSGGYTRVDSRGRTWWGDPGAGDTLSIRVDDRGGAQAAENWVRTGLTTQPDAMKSLGFDPTNPNDLYIFGTIRWDVGDDVDPLIGIPGDPSDDIPFLMEIPIPNGSYKLCLYFAEAGWPLRHFTLEIEGNMAMDDINYTVYDPLDPSLGRLGRLVFDVDVSDGALSLAFLPCYTCPVPPPNAVNLDSIINAIEILPATEVIRTCPRSLMTTLDIDRTVTGNWAAPENVTLTGYNLYRDGKLIDSLPADAVDFIDTPEGCSRAVVYELEPLSSDPNFLCPGERMRSVLIDPSCPFTSPVRIHFGGATVFDSKGNLWLGDGASNDDPLDIRPDHNVGQYWIENWGGPWNPASLADIGWDPASPLDAYIFNSIRYGGNWGLLIPLENGEYTVNMYFTEECCPNRHMSISLQGAVVAPDTGPHVWGGGVLGRVGKESFEKIIVQSGTLQIGFQACPTCPGGGDPNPIIDALEIFYTGTAPPRAPTGLKATAGDSKVDLVWNEVPGVAGYNLYRTEKVGTELTKVNTDLITVTSYTDKTVVNDTKYYFYVRAVSVDGKESRNSIGATATPKGTGGPKFRRGDTNDDGKVDLSDAIVTLSYLFQGGTTPTCFDATDADDSGVLDLTDGIFPLTWLFQGGPEPPAPGPKDCGPDTTPQKPEQKPFPACVYTKCQ